MTQKKLILFHAINRGWGSRKIFLISNYLASKLKKTFLITAEKNISKKLKNIEIIYPKSNFWKKRSFKKVYNLYLFIN